jgi:hypothetical protein
VRSREEEPPIEVGDKVWVRGCHDRYTPTVLEIRDDGVALCRSFGGGSITEHNVSDLERWKKLKSKRRNK